MTRYFIEVAYKGTNYSGFQIQENANTIQSEIEKALKILNRFPIALTGSSRTDAGVHALQNYFHFDFEEELNPKFLYKINSLLPNDIVIKSIHKKDVRAHCRFDATSREYEYKIYQTKDPFIKDYAFYYPYSLDFELLSKASFIIKEQTNFFAFAKTNSQVNNYNCIIQKSQWYFQNQTLIYNVKGNRFLRGMVRLLTATQLQVARKKMTLDQFIELFQNNIKCSLSVPPQGLFLSSVEYPLNYFK